MTGKIFLGLGVCLLLFATAAPVLAQGNVRASSGGFESIIVIDPGHGGADTGVRGPGGLLEKDLSLALAGRLKEKLAVNLGVKVILTRSGDFHLTGRERAAIANHNKAALFISLHLGSSASQTADNFTSFYARPRPSELERATEGDDLFWRAWNEQNEPYQDTSRRLARFIQIGLSSWLVRDAADPIGGDWLVLKGVGCPAAMVELGCLSNPERERSYREKDFLEDLSSVLYRTIADFLGDQNG